MIPDRVVEVLHGPAFMQAGSCDAKLRPAHTLVIGAVVHPDREHVTFFVPESRSEQILANFKENGKIALTMGMVTHEAYQLKGVYVSSRPTDEKDLAVQEIYRAKLCSMILQAYPEQIAKPMAFGFAYQPGIAITFRAAEVFLQTPGPEAGKKIA
jgi:hypothetical protein